MTSVVTEHFHQNISRSRFSIEPYKVIVLLLQHRPYLISFLLSVGVATLHYISVMKTARWETTSSYLFIFFACTCSGKHI